ncbi:MAG: hypothetical protein HGA48_00025 [Candidatus Yonathbacteria bacterium]|nr:hypothetical protein [Candidatus Yonathbacteria bacterium]
MNGTEICERQNQEGIESHHVLDEQKRLEEFLAKDEASEIIEHLDQFQYLDHNYIAEMIIKRVEGSFVAKHLEKFQGLDHNVIAEMIIKTGRGSSVAECLEKFQGLDHHKIAEMLINANGGSSVVEYLEKFQGLDHNHIAEMLIKVGHAWSVAENLEKFQGLDHNHIAEMIIKSGGGSSVVEYLERFQGLDHNHITEMIIKAGGGSFVARHLEKFQGLDHNHIAEMLINAGVGWSIAKNLEKFQGLNAETAICFVKHGEYGGVLENIQKFSDFTYDSLEKGVPDQVALYEQSLQGIDIPMNTFRNVRVFLALYDEMVENPDHIKHLLKENPFLIDAVGNNARFGTKLLTSFSQFDTLAKEEISSLYAYKKDILASYPHIDPASAGFRILMQERLKDFKENASTLEYLAEDGIDVRKWLEYDEERFFDLGKEDDVPFSEQIKSPVKRIDASLGNYFNRVREVVREYKDILEHAELPSEKETELRVNLEDMRAKQVNAEISGDTAKVAGIGKGIANLERQIDSLKPSTVWNKLIGDMNNFGMVVKGLTTEYEALQALEESARMVTDRKELIVLKEKIGKAEDAIKEKIAKVDDGLTAFQNTLGEVLGTKLGTDRKDAVLQEIMETLGEDFDHYRTDLSTVRNLLNESESSLEGTPMRLAIASRDPDVDLYLGNYCPCCIRIDSDIHGAESPIADFVTDLGMHNIVVYDEKRKKPVVTAWCFAGYNEGDDEPFLVIDNIEADTDYSASFRSQLEKEIKDYITRFAVASSIRADHIIQGLHNNDLEAFPLDEIDWKIGGENRATGYYLEAERDNEEEHDGYDGEDDEEEDE